MTGWRIVPSPRLARYGDLGDSYNASDLTPAQQVARHPGWPTHEHADAWLALRGKGAQRARDLSWWPRHVRYWLRANLILVPAGRAGRHRLWVVLDCCNDVADALDEHALASLTRYLPGRPNAACDCGSKDCRRRQRAARRAENHPWATRFDTPTGREALAATERTLDRWLG